MSDQAPPLDQHDTITYAQSGVDEPREQAAVARMRHHFSQTLNIRTGIGRPLADPDHFGSLIDIGAGLALAISTDGVGTKLLIAQELRTYRDVAIDLVANNVNDVLCMGAEPVGIVDYIGIDVADERFLEEFAESFSKASLEAGVSVVGGEIAQIGEMLNPAHASPRFDLVATAVGLCRLSAQTPGTLPVALNRASVRVEQVLVGVPSSGLHSNGLSLARKALLGIGKFTLDSTPAALGGSTLSSAFLTPTRIYVDSILPLLKQGLITGLANISGGGLLTLSRLNPRMSFEVTTLPTTPAIFELIQESGKLATATMFSTFNMGIGMVMSVERNNLQAVFDSLVASGELPFEIGSVNDRDPGSVFVRPKHLRGFGDAFLANKPGSATA